MTAGSSPLDGRAEQLAAIYADQDGHCLAELLCDRHDPVGIAFRLIGADGHRDLSFGELHERSVALAAGLSSHGIGPGARVATLMGKSAELVVTLLAIWRLGAVHVPLFTAFAADGIAVRLRGCAANVVVCDAGQREKLNDALLDDLGQPVLLVTLGDAEKDGRAIGWSDLCEGSGTAPPRHISGPDDAMICIFTSGTTGTPKGVEMPVRGLAAIHAYAEFGLAITADDTYWCAADPGWAYGLYYAVVAPLLLGQRALLLEGGFDPARTFAVLEAEGVTNFAAAPTVYRALRASGKAPPAGLAIRKLSSAGEPLPADLNDWAPQALGAPILDHYGQTEAGMIVNNHHHPMLHERPVPGSMGKAMPGWSVVVLDPESREPLPSDEPGELAVDLTRSPLAWFGGYLGDAERSAAKFSADGRWYLTGDSARIDPAGRVHFASRADDVILMAGYRIGPFEIEAVLNAHQAVAGSAAVATPDTLLGERLEAFVVLGEGFEPSSELTVELQQWVKHKYAAHAYPRKIHYIDELPLTPSGKLQRFKLRLSLESSN